MAVDETVAGSTPRIIGMRDGYFEELFEIFKSDPRCMFITADNGAPSLDRFARELPRQYRTVGIAEQQAIGMAVGMSLEGRKVWTYAIAPFMTVRVAEQVKVDVCGMAQDVTILGVGAGYAYDIMGPTHHTVEDVSVMRSFPVLEIWSPADTTTARALARRLYHARPGPRYVRFDRTGLSDIDVPLDSDGTRWLGPGPRGGCGVVIVSTGVMTHNALRLAANLELVGWRAGVLDVVRLHPFHGSFLDAVRGAYVITLEEHLLQGGLGSIVLERFNDLRAGRGLDTVLRLGARNTFTFTYGGREAIWKFHGLDDESVLERVTAWLHQEVKQE